MILLHSTHKEESICQSIKHRQTDRQTDRLVASSERTVDKRYRVFSRNDYVSKYNTIDRQTDRVIARKMARATSR